MLTVFDREFRREKTLDVTKKLAAKAAPKKEVAEDNQAKNLEERLSSIEENFFKEVGEDEEEIKMIKERAA